MRPFQCAAAAILLASVVVAGCAEKGTTDAGALLERVVTLPYSRGSFHEVNLEMGARASLEYNWTVVGAQQSIRFDIHTHDASGVKYAEQGAWRQKSGSYVHPAPGLVSLFWENAGPSQVDLDYRIEGDFTVKSVQGP